MNRLFEIVKSFYEEVMNFLPLIFTTIFNSSLSIILGAIIIIIVLRLSGKYLEDSNLEQYLLNKIKKEIGKKRTYVSEFVFKKDVKLFNRNTIVYVGYSKNIETSRFDGRHIHFFDISVPTLLDRIVSRPGGYNMSYEFNLLIPNGIGDKEFFIPTNYQFIDLDNNGKEELLLEFTFTFADRLSNSFLIFYEDKGKWYYVKPPNLKEVLDELENIYIYQEVYEMELNSFMEKFVAYSNGGFYVFGRFDLNREHNLFISIPINEGEAVLSPHQRLFFMFRFTDHKFILDENWNNGKPLLNKLAKKKYSEDELNDIIIGGYKRQQIGDVRFYKGPLFGKLRNLSI